MSKGDRPRLQICQLLCYKFQGSLSADADAPRGWGVHGEGVCAMLSLFVLLFCFVNIHSGCFKSNHQPRSEGGTVFTNVRLCVCQHGSVTPEPLEILRDFQGLILWAKGRPCSKMTTYGCAASGLTSLASTVSNIIRLFSS